MEPSIKEVAKGVYIVLLDNGQGIVIIDNKPVWYGCQDIAYEIAYGRSIDRHPFGQLVLKYM